MTLTYRLFLLVAIALLPAIAIQAYNEIDLRQSREAEVHESAIRQARLAASEIDQIFTGVRNLLTAVAEAPAVKALDTAACVPYLAGLRPKVPYLVSITALDREGRLACYHEPPPIDVRFADRPYFQAAIAGDGFVVGEYTQDRISKQPVLPVATPLRDGEGRVLGVVAATLDLGWLNRQLRDRALPKGGSLTVADRNAVIIAREPFPERFVGTRIPEQFRHLLTALAPGSLELDSQDGTRRVLGYIPLGLASQGLYVSAGISSQQAFAAIDRATTRGIVLIVAGLLLALAAARLAGHYVFDRPVARLLAAAARWQAGDYGARTGLSSHAGEFGALGAAFDRMVEEVARREAERDKALLALRESEGRLRRAQEAGAIGDWAWDTASGELTWSASLYRLLGVEPEGGLAPETLIHPDDRERVRAEARAAAISGTPLESEFRVVRPDGEVRWLMGRGELERGEASRPPRLVGVNIDITARKQAEGRQRLLLAELNHRVKNILATVQAIASRSLADDRTPAEARAALGERLRALAKTHDLLTASAWRGASLRAIAEAELHPYGRRVEVANDDIVLAPRAAQTLGLVLHELATNAAKHGALSVPEGRVALTWRVEPDPAGDRFHLDWREQGGPAVRPPTRQGFGRALIERAIGHELKGTAQLHFLPEGLLYTLEAPSAEIAA